MAFLTQRAARTPYPARKTGGLRLQEQDAVPQNNFTHAGVPQLG